MTRMTDNQPEQYPAEHLGFFRGVLILFVIAAILVGCAFKCKSEGISEEFLDKLALLESGNNPNAIGDGGKSRGLFQMKLEAWLEVSEYFQSIGLTVHPFSQAFNPVVSRQYAR